eukprot:GSChrysophyteH2.ASY1.ANO1.495.1 assembled CDS
MSLGSLLSFAASVSFGYCSKWLWGRNDLHSLVSAEPDDDNSTSYLDGFTVVTRIHTTSAGKIVDADKVRDFVDSVLEYAEKVIVCVGFRHTKKYKEYIFSLQKTLDPRTIARVVLLPVSPWGRFTSALNSAIVRAMDEQYRYIAFQSLEFRVPVEAVRKLLLQMQADRNLLVVGPAMNGHQYRLGKQELRGRTCPWNTFAIWSLPHLSLTGFPMIGDGQGQCPGGVEEVSAISLLQTINPKLKACLVQIPSIQWSTNFQDPQRAEWHERKMSSKDERPHHQLKVAGLRAGNVHHTI